METRHFLGTIEIFGKLGDEALDRLAQGAWIRDYSANQAILRMGQCVDSIGVIMSGKVEVRRDAAAGAAGNPVLEKGQIFGEMSLLTGEPAIADVIAAASTRIVHVSHEALTVEISRNLQAAQGFGRLLTTRLMSRSSDKGERDAMERARTRAQGMDRPDDGSAPVFVLNLGSSSIKYAVFSGGAKRCAGLVENVGRPGTRILHDGPGGRVETDLGEADHEGGLSRVFEMIVHPEHGSLDRLEQLGAVGHRTVHGGVRFTESVVIDDEVVAQMERTSVLAPLHNPVNLLGIRLCEKLLPAGLPQVAVFDTAFHMTMPEHAYRYAIPKELADAEQLRRFGFHGTSHKYVSETATAFLGAAPKSLKVITCHLGNGASITAVDHGRSVDTSMGLTPLEGLVMGTRCGDVDPGLVLHLLSTGRSREDLDRMLNKESGLKGLSGLSSDMRELEAAADAGHAGALLAIQSFCYRVRKYVGAYTAAMSGVDALVFTGGIGEHAAGIRSRICAGLGFLGIELDEQRNRARIEPAARALLVSRDDAPVRVLVVPTDEEGAIAAETVGALKRSGASQIIRNRRDRRIPIGVSAHHVHLCTEHVEALFGPGHVLTPRNELTQKGYFACEEAVDLVGPKGRVDRVRILGPERPETQVEISRTEEFKLGIDAPIRASGDVRNSPGIRLVGPMGELEIAEGVICAYRHIHMGPEDALAYGIRDRDLVRVEVDGERSLIFGDVLVRVFPGWTTEMHIDTDEANAAEVSVGATCTIESIQRRAS
jgi:acetate kinase